MVIERKQKSARREMTPTEARNILASLPSGKGWEADDFTEAQAPRHATEIEEAMAVLLNWAIKELEK